MLNPRSRSLARGQLWFLRSILLPPFFCLWFWLCRLWISSLACLVLLTGCASATGSPKDLANRLCGLSPTIDPAEATLTAETAYSYSLQLAKEYRVVRPALFHNILVNWGIRQRGLCFQWADDLSAKLQTLHLRSFDMHRGVANLDTRHEHSSVVLTAVGQPFDKGIALDAWRHSGHLVWVGVKEDPDYPWIEVEVLPDDPPSPTGRSGK